MTFSILKATCCNRLQHISTTATSSHHVRSADFLLRRNFDSMTETSACLRQNSLNPLPPSQNTSCLLLMYLSKYRIVSTLRYYPYSLFIHANHARRHTTTVLSSTDHSPLLPLPLLQLLFLLPPIWFEYTRISSCCS